MKNNALHEILTAN